MNRKDEFINLTFMNSVWLEYVLANANGSIRISGRAVDFAYLAPYLKTAIEYCREREKITAEQVRSICPALLENKEWPALLSDWMLENDIHNFSEYRIKQFCKAVSNSVIS